MPSSVADGEELRLRARGGRGLMPLGRLIQSLGPRPQDRRSLPGFSPFIPLSFYILPSPPFTQGVRAVPMGSEAGSFPVTNGLSEL